MGRRWYTALTLALCVSWTSPVLAGGVFRFPLFYVPTSLDPIKDELVSTYHIVQQVYDGLVAFDSNLRVVPGLARSWTVSRDGKVYTFTLREDVKFHDGTTLGAEDVVASLTRIFGPGSQTGSKQFLYKIEGAQAYREGKADTVTGIRVEEPGKVSITLSEPYPALLSVLGMPVTKIVPAHLVGDPAATLDRNPVGTGPFRFRSWEEGVITLVANEHYFAGVPDLEELRFLFYPGEARERAFPDFMEGKLEGCPLPEAADLDDLRGKGYQVLVRPRMSILFYGMNTRTAPLDDPGIRIALARGFNRERYVEEVLHSKHIPADQIVPPGMPGYSPDNALLSFDRDEAVRHLAASRYPGGKGMSELVVASVSHSDAAKAELEMFRKDMNAIGIRIRPLFVDTWEEFKEGIEKGSYSLYRYALHADIPDPEDLLPDLVGAKGAHNFMGYGNPALDSIFDNARRSTEPMERITLYREAERKVLLDPPFVPIVFISTQVAFQRNVNNADLPATGTPYLPLRKVTLADAP